MRQPVPPLCTASSEDLSQQLQLVSIGLQLGGNDAAIVLDDVDPAAIAPKLFGAAMGNSGQICVALKRLCVLALRQLHTQLSFLCYSTMCKSLHCNGCIRLSFQSLNRSNLRKNTFIIYPVTHTATVALSPRICSSVLSTRVLMKFFSLHAVFLPFCWL